MTLRTLALVVMVLFGGVWSGGILFIALERVRSWSRMSVEAYAADFRRTMKLMEPMMPVCGLAAIASSIAFGLASQGVARTSAWSGAVLIVLVSILSGVFTGKINLAFLRSAEGEIPEGAAGYRVFWARFHHLRTVAALVAFACLTLAAASPA